MLQKVCLYFFYSWLEGNHLKSCHVNAFAMERKNSFFILGSFYSIDCICWFIFVWIVYLLGIECLFYGFLIVNVSTVEYLNLRYVWIDRQRVWIEQYRIKSWIYRTCHVFQYQSVSVSISQSQSESVSAQEYKNVSSRSLQILKLQTTNNKIYTIRCRFVLFVFTW